MVLVLKNDQMENLLPMGEEIDAIEQAFRELGRGVAMNAPRARREVHGTAHRFQLFQGSASRRQQAPRLSR
jgi:ornithine cyclodeaminase/alanine dehydrogenase-like protein (mu-crystallin family)